MENVHLTETYYKIGEQR